MKKIRILLLISWLLVSIAYAKEQPGLDFLLSAARNGDVEAMCDLGVVYFKGKKTLKDPFKAKCWIKRAHDQGSLRAQRLWEELSLWQYSGKCGAYFDDGPRPKYTRGENYTEPVTGVEFVFVPKGCFQMGCSPMASKCKKNEKPPHKVCLKGFWMGKYEVSQKQWHWIMKENPSRFKTDLNRPVENVSFEDVQKFISKLNSKTGRTFSLPTEAQWEYTCRSAGEKKDFPGDHDTSYRLSANCGTCDSGDFNGETSPVGSFPPNALGVYDMAGNIKEWCLDIYNKRAYKLHAKDNPVYEGKGPSRVVRGGSFADIASKLRCSARDKSIPGMRSDRMGFRLVMVQGD